VEGAVTKTLGGTVKRVLRNVMKNGALELERELLELRARVHDWHYALRTDPAHIKAISPWLPPGPLLSCTPQRYTENYQKYIERGGKMRPADDIIGFVAQNPINAFDCARFFLFCLVIDLIATDRLQGDLAELGVDTGNSASVLARGAQRLGKSIYLLDTFQGFAEQDFVGNEARHRGGYTDTSLHRVTQIVDGDHVRFIQGYFPASTARMPQDVSFCLVHLDCDLYKPFAAGLEYFWPRLVPGGFLLMHDYTTMHWEGVERACNEFFASKAESIIPIPDTSGTVVVRKNKTKVIGPDEC
jgi:O-methyltransferase